MSDDSGGAASPLLYAHGAYGEFAAPGTGGGPEGLWMPTWNYD
ncbi:MAG: hypothetical protein ACREU3_05935 [Steroidobacteraceae bacterium]